ILSLKSLLPAEPNQEQEIEKFRASLVELRRMKRDAERRPGNSFGHGTGECDSPRQQSRLSIAAAGDETPEAPDRVPQRHRSGGKVENREERHLFNARIGNRPDDPAENASIKCSGRLDHRKAENLARVREIVVPFAGDEPEL